jgi:hypothetical protein
VTGGLQTLDVNKWCIIKLITSWSRVLGKAIVAQLVKESPPFMQRVSLLLLKNQVEWSVIYGLFLVSPLHVSVFIDHHQRVISLFTSVLFRDYCPCFNTIYNC